MKELRSENGSNFFGADLEIKEAIEQIDKEIREARMTMNLSHPVIS